MKAIAIIAEYNPFHEGHAYQIQQLRKQYPSATIIAIMSGPFTQRGEPSFIDKWTKTKMALSYVDLVIELPYKFATGAADTFAKGGVFLAHALGAEALSFGSEDGHIHSFSHYATQWMRHEKTIEEKAKKMKHTPYIQALYQAAESIIGPPPFDHRQPNNILAFAYAKINVTYQLQLLTHERIGANYHDTSGNRQFASASGIRAFIQSEETLPRHLPKQTAELLASYRGNWGSMETMYPLLRAELLRTPPAQLTHFFEVAEGMEQRFIRAAHVADNFSNWLCEVQVKHWTNARIQRAATHIVTHFTKSDHDRTPLPTYIRLLGATRRGRAYLKEERQHIHLPVVFSPKQCPHDALMQIDVRAQNIYTMLTNSQASSRTVQRDYAEPPIFPS